LNRQSSIHHTSEAGRNRSPPSSTGFVDLAHQGFYLLFVYKPFAHLSLNLSGKKQFNSMINFLNEGNKNGPNKEVLGRPETAVRGVRAKREADDAG
jgi:hypothetical protein